MPRTGASKIKLLHNCQLFRAARQRHDASLFVSLAQRKPRRQTGAGAGLVSAALKSSRTQRRCSGASRPSGFAAILLSAGYLISPIGAKLELFREFQSASILPFIRKTGTVFDNYATEAMGEAFDAACKELHDTGQPQIVYEVIAKRIIDKARRAASEMSPGCGMLD